MIGGRKQVQGAAHGQRASPATGQTTASSEGDGVDIVVLAATDDDHT